MGTIIEKLTAMTSAKDDALRDVASLGALDPPDGHLVL